MTHAYVSFMTLFFLVINNDRIIHSTECMVSCFIFPCMLSTRYEYDMLRYFMTHKPKNKLDRNALFSRISVRVRWLVLRSSMWYVQFYISMYEKSHRNCLEYSQSRSSEHSIFSNPPPLWIPEPPPPDFCFMYDTRYVRVHSLFRPTDSSCTTWIAPLVYCTPLQQ